MEGINTIISYPYRDIGGLLGSPGTPSSAISFGSGIIGYAKGAEVLDIGGSGIEGNKISPLSTISQHFYYTNVYRSKPSEISIDNKLWQKNLNIILVNTFMGKFVLKYRIDDYKNVYAYLLENEHLTPFIEDSIAKLEEYFAKNIKDMVLKIQSDSEDESNDGGLYLELISSVNVDDAFELFSKFQIEWFIPTLGSKIALFNIILK